MPLDPQIQAFLDQTAQGQATPLTHDSYLKRERSKTAEIVALGGEPELVAFTETLAIPGPLGDIPARLYTPEGLGPFPILVFFHGGGWISGNIDTHDSMCRSLCSGTGCLVLSVAYRLAPEYKFPAGLEDCYAATCWIAESAEQFHGDAERIAVGGESEGANLAAVVAQLVRDWGGPQLTLQVLLYPCMDLQHETPSWQENASYGITKEQSDILRDLYLVQRSEQTNPYVSPLLATDLDELPPALIITAEYDPRRDEAELYGQQLQAAGVPTTLARYDGMIHGFALLKTIVPQAQQALDKASATLRAAFAHKGRA